MMNHTPIPIIELWGNLLVPLQGDILDSQADELQTQVLERIRDRGVDGLVIDASGVWMMDSHLCAMLGRLAASARLMGARPVLCGLGPTVVLTLQTMGLDLEGIETAVGLEAALEVLGVSVVQNNESNREDR
jgi:rsbT antagonist protein RsbS